MKSTVRDDHKHIRRTYVPTSDDPMPERSRSRNNEQKPQRECRIHKSRTKPTNH